MAKLAVALRGPFSKEIGVSSLDATASPLGSSKSSKERSSFYLVFVRSFHREICILADLLQGNVSQKSFDWRLVGGDNEKKNLPLAEYNPCHPGRNRSHYSQS